MDSQQKQTINNIITVQPMKYDPQDPQGQISPVKYYLNVCKVYFAEFNEIIIKGIGDQIYTATIVAENLIRKGFAEWRKLETITIEKEKGGKQAQVVAILAKSQFYGQRLIDEAKKQQNIENRQMNQRPPRNQGQMNERQQQRDYRPQQDNRGGRKGGERGNRELDREEEYQERDVRPPRGNKNQ